jgi:gluconolactonase
MDGKSVFGIASRMRRRILIPALLLALPGCAESPDESVAASESAASADVYVERMDPRLDDLIAPGVVPEPVASGFKFLEGPVWTDGRLWFSDLMDDKLYSLEPDGQTLLLLENSGGAADGQKGDYPGSNGAVEYLADSVLMAQHGARRIVQVSRDLSITPFIERDAEGRRLNSPNDLVFAPDGALWFTDPPFGLPAFGEDPAKEIPFNGVYRWQNGQISAVITDLPNPNGIAVSPDGRRLYVSNSGPELFVMIYDLSEAGEVSNPRRLISYDGPRPSDVPDGLKVDSQGNIWTTGPGGIRIITPEGQVLGQIRTPEPAQANLVWGGPDLRTVYITASDKVYRLSVRVPGLASLYGE